MAVAPILQHHRLTTSLDISLGYSQSNIGEQVADNINPSISDLLLRILRLGYGVSSSLAVEIGQLHCKPSVAHLTAEVSDIWSIFT